MLGSHVLAECLGCFGALAFGSIHSSFGHLHIDDLAFDETAAFERIHVVQPLITLRAIGRLQSFG